MLKKMFALFTSVIAGLAVVGVAWAGGDDDTSTSVTAASETSASVSSEVFTPSTEVTVPDASTSTSVNASTSTSAGASTPTSTDSSTSTSIAATTSTSTGSSTSTSFDDSDARQAPDGIRTHIIPGVGTVTVEVSSNQLVLVSVSAPGWHVERKKLRPDRIELEFTDGLEAEAEFEARLNNGRLEVEIEVDLG